MQEFFTALPDQWRQVLGLFFSPIAWIPRTHDLLIDFFFNSSSAWTAAAKYVLLLFPAVLGLAAIWCTQLSIYTLPFRSARLAFVSAVLLTWWDAARAVWLYWMGLIRLASVLIGWLVVLVAFVTRTMIHATRHVLTMPFLLTGRVTTRYFEPGVPWIAFLALLFWSVLEAAIFAHVLYAPVTEILADLAETHGAVPFVGSGLFLFVFVMIAGSFACAQAVVDALRSRQVKFLAHLLGIAVFVAFFEVMFLYRELTVVLMPWLVERPVAVVGIAAAGWLGVRASTWVLFGQHGTASLTAFIARRPLVAPEARASASSAPAPWWEAPLRDGKNELDWLHAKSDRLLEYLALPALHVIAAAVNFAMVLIASRPVFQLPFKHLEEIPETRTILTGLHLQPRKP